jgi:hypothetical protein
MKDNAIYLEVDEDITSAIDKLNKVSGATAQIVVPKRSTLLQSVINQKLLKKAADKAGKKLVLVTNDRVATDLAARVGLAVATSVGAEAVLTAAKKAAPALADDVIEDGDPEPPAAAVEAAQPSPIADSKDAKPSKASRKAAPVVATRALSDDEPTPPGAAADAAGSAKAGKQPKVPNFSKLRKRALWIGGIAAVVVAYLLGMYFYSSGSVIIFADGARSDIDATFNVDTSLTKTDTSSTTVAGQSLTTSHNLSTTFTPTGSENVGTKATGTMTVTNNDTSAHDFVAGTRFVAPDGNVFLLNSDLPVAAAQPVVCGHQFCTQPTTATGAVTASSNGDNYNEAGGQAYSIPGLGTQTLVTAKGSAMAGGTTKTVQVVTQTDVTNATNAAVTSDKASAQKALQAKVAPGDMALTASLVATPTAVTSNPPVGGQGSQATLTMTVNYTMLSVNKKDFTAVIENIESKQLGSGNQVYDNGIGNANITAGAVSGTSQSFRFVTTASGGPRFDTTSIVNNLRGKKYSDATDYVTGLPGVVKATVSLSPAWSTSMPHVAKHIQVHIRVSQD